ncbi:MAG: aminotransferase class I/II-fold pyridoxal phosphate-dependent enzyme [Actinobacteria bacterium]|nr:aminotransferase class I/II-fold pyridoxal phosphate-dependent enzyme [Actinomycetota bacterium]
MERVAASIGDRSPQGIAAALGRLIGSGDIAAGERLPTVRDLARELGVSPGTVAEAWRMLTVVGAIEARGRAGTFALRTSGLAHRYRSLASGGGALALDLSTGIPDPALLPELGPLLRRVGGKALSGSYLDRPVLPQLEELLVNSWPFAPGGFTVVDGALDALSRVADLIVGFGDRVLIENPAFPPLIDLLERQGAELIALPLDSEGIVPSALSDALQLRPSTLFLQPRAHNPTGISMSEPRARELSLLLRDHPITVVEDDHCGDISIADDVSLGRYLDNRVIHIRSFSKSHGPDLRIAAVGGPAELIDRLVERRLLGPGWTSRMVQSLLVELLTDPDSIDVVAQARRTYAQRQRELAGALASCGLPLAAGDGINQWVPVVDERLALVRAAAAGIGVAPGAPFVLPGLAGDHVRVTVGLISSGAEHVAQCLAAAALPAPQSRAV